jgi:hypothetical protein
MPENHLPEVAGFQLFLSGRVWVFGDTSMPIQSQEESIPSLELTAWMEPRR